MPENSIEIYGAIAEYLTAKKGLCTLVLGPDLAVNQLGASYKVYFRKLADDNKNEIYKYFEKENLFSFIDNIGLRKTRSQVKKFYNDCGDKVLLEMISRVRFPLIINVSPDTALNKIYTDKKIDYKEGYFSEDSNQNFWDLPYPSKELPVIFNIFGWTEPDTSLIFEHSKLYQTIGKLLPDNSLPPKIEQFLTDSSGFILLGFKFDSWQYQLMCHKLKLKGKATKVNLSTPEIDDTSSVSMVMRKQFEIEFAKDNPAQAIEKIIKECKESAEALRPKNPYSSYSLFVSYAWAEKEAAAAEANRETVVNWMEKYSTLTNEKLLLFFRDHTDLGYGESIDSFMTRIGKGKTVIRVISDKYLKSRYCMIEAMRIANYQDEEERIFTVLWEDADLANEIAYRDFWKGKCQAILENIDQKLDNDIYDDSVLIYRFIPRFFKKINDRVNLRIGKKDFIIDPQTGRIDIVETRKEEFTKFIETIISKIKDN
jgi:hypothetical protein